MAMTKGAVASLRAEVDRLRADNDNLRERCGMLSEALAWASEHAVRAIAALAGRKQGDGREPEEG